MKYFHQNHFFFPFNSLWPHLILSLCQYISLHCDFLCFFSKSLCQHHQSLSLHWDHRDMKHAFYNIETCLKSMPRLLVQHPNSKSVSLFVLAWWNTWWCFCRRRKGEDEEWWGLMLRSLAQSNLIVLTIKDSSI